MSDPIEAKILEFLGAVPGKGVEVSAKIAKAVGGRRKEVATALRKLEEQGKIMQAGAMAGVIGYKLKS
jgi:hypothetical protein